jgi:hypothetical protein
MIFTQLSPSCTQPSQALNPAYRADCPAQRFLVVLTRTAVNFMYVILRCFINQDCPVRDLSVESYRNFPKAICIRLGKVRLSMLMQERRGASKKRHHVVQSKGWHSHLCAMPKNDRLASVHDICFVMFQASSFSVSTLSVVT